jgi:caffeoyl-CoA O-methyltransferase
MRETRGGLDTVFHDVPGPIAERMRILEGLDAEHRSGDMPHLERLRQVPRVTGKLLALMASLVPAGTYLEIGTSGGYSALWISLACRERGRRLTTFELSGAKIELAQATFTAAGVGDVIELVPGDARENIPHYEGVSFCFLDAEKEVYADCYELVVPKMVPGGVLLADNVISHEEILRPMIDAALADPRTDSLVVPIGSGVLMARRLEWP